VKDVDRCRALLRDTTPGSVLTGGDARFIAGVLERHPEAARKIGAGVAYFSVQLNPTYGNPSFWLHRIDGTATDFSFLKCLRRQSRTQVLMRALRRAVAPDIIRFRNQALDAAGVVACPITGEPALIGNCDVDHVPPRTFARLAAEFIRAEGGEASIRLDNPDGETGAVMIDASQECRWREFQRANATLRILSVRGNALGANIGQ
jgi:Protein of unknown function (DUF3223)